MRTFSSIDFLELWECASALHPLDQGLLAPSAALPEIPCDVLADWPLGRRNRALAELRCRHFGPVFKGWIACPQCAERLEFEIDGRALAGEPGDLTSSPPGPVTVNGRSYRLPTSRDLAHAAGEATPEAAAARLLQSCRLGDDEPSHSSEELEAVGEQLAPADPMAETMLALRCDACGFEWEEALDLTTFFWTEVDAKARRLLMEVHVLASSYGWTEPEILALSERRRAFYLEAVRA